MNVELTDGWYKINAALDPILTDAVCRLNILTGDKLAVCGAKV